jgi:hypothetical protein
VRVQRQRGGTRGRGWLHGAPTHQEGAVDGATRQFETPGREATDPELPEPETTRSGTSDDAFDEVLRHAGEARAERDDDED